ncbi:MAG: metalloregulator ArsR/SmtB family transcription factor [Porticoccaceae bacterium]|nr:winged helix-turn-helix transcriptional regulator [Pseudomonadales bacterium]MCP5172216.1 winged helix-turn-helix transcriptional regulator [Pseudomonadales bacterium]
MNIKEMQENADEAASLLKLIANPSRLLVLCALVTREHTAGELEELVGLSQSAVSQHLAKLRHQNMVATRRDGQKIYYSLKNPRVKQVITTMHSIYCNSL